MYTLIDENNDFFVIDKHQGVISGDLERGRRGAWKMLRTKEDPRNERI